MTEQLTEPAIDKSTWGPGAWQDEPDRVDFVHAGFACLALRHPRHGSWCGYVGVPREHPLHGKEWTEDGRVEDLKAHRGVDYSARCQDDICHEPAPGMPADVWWLGFSCSHAFDQCPGVDARCGPISRAHEATLTIPEEMREVYRALPYVRGAIERLAEQLAALTTS